MIRTTTAVLSAALMSLLSAAVSAAPNLIPNTVKYKDSSLSSANGRSGSAVLAGRALINIDGTADLDLTTGDFDGTPARGSIEKVQVKVDGAAGAQNYTGLTNAGTASFKLDGVPRHATVGVQANVRDYDGTRNDVVSVAPVAGLRPDLVAGSIEAPSQAVVSMPVMIFATVHERNGDNGARADCVLSVDGNEADRAAGIWVDAGDSVACRFAHAFDSLGTHQLQIAITNVAPADWETDNNSASASIDVLQQMDSWVASAHEESWERHSVFKAPWQSYQTDEHGWEALSSFTGLFKSSNVDFENAHVSFRQTSDGATFADVADVPFIGEAGRYPDCKEFSDDRVYAWVCKPGWPKNFPYENFDENVIGISAGRSSMNIVYHSFGTDLRGQQYDSAYTQVQGVQQSYGNTVETFVGVTDGVKGVAADAVIPLTPFSRYVDQPYSCRGPFCSSQYDSTTGKDGRVSHDW